MKSFKTVGKHLLIALLIHAQIMIPVSTAYANAMTKAATRKPASSPAAEKEAPLDPLTREVLEFVKPPVVQAIEAAKEVPPVDLKFSSADPVLDEDPFFLRAQSWEKDEEISLRASFSSELKYESTRLAGGLRIRVSGSGVDSTWNLKADLRPVLETSAYLFLVPNSDRFFADKGAGEGLFYIPKVEFQQAMGLGQATPIYFFPLPNGRWHALEELSEMESVEALFARDGEGIPTRIAYQDLDLVAKAERNNFVFSTAFAVEKLAKQIREKKLPASETAKLKAALESYFAQLRSSSDEVDPQKLVGTIQGLQTALNILPLPKSTAGFGTLLLDRPAYARLFGDREPSSEKPALTPEQQKIVDDQRAKLIDRATRVGIILAAGLIISVGLRYTKYREHFVQKRMEKGITDVSKLSVLKRARIYSDEILDVYAHALTTLVQVPTQTAGHALMNLTDRFLPKQMASENLWIRKMLNKTVLLSVRSGTKIPVNANTWYKGVIILGGVDTAFVGVQLYQVVPWAAHQIAAAIPSLESRVNDAFQVGDPLIEEFNRNELIRNGFAYSTSGAMSMSADARSKVFQIIEGTVEQDLRREGYNLAEGSTQELKQKRIEALVKEQMTRLGLPNAEEFLFDYQTILESLYSFLGYRQLGTEGGLHYVGEKRTGLWHPALDEAVQRLKREAKAGSVEAIAALPVLEKARSETALLRNLLKGLTSGGIPKRSTLAETMQALRAARKSLLALTYEGPQDAAIRNLPGGWVERFGQSGSEYAAKTFRSAFFGYLGEAEPEIELPEGRFARWQRYRAAERASEAYRKEFGVAFDAASGAERETWWRDAYRGAFLKIVGIHPDYAANPTLEKEVLTPVDAVVKQKVESADFQAKLAKQSFFQQQMAIADVKSEAEIAEYLRKTVWSASVSRLDPAQPGLTQRIRQVTWFRGEGFLPRASVRAMRFVDAFFAEAEYQPGMSSAIYRYVPGAFDLWQGIARSIRNAPMSLTATFLWQHLFWGADISWVNWTYFTLFTSFTISGPAMLVSRIFEHQAWRPIKSLVLMTVLASAHSWATFWGSVPSYIFARDFNEHFVKIFTTTVGLIGANLGWQQFRENRQRRLLKAAEAGATADVKRGSFWERCRSLFRKAGR